MSKDDPALPLGCPFDLLGIQLRRVGSGKRMTFTHEGEARLSAWMADNALVSWIAQDRPWELEERLIRSVPLPLNLQGNRHHGFHGHLSAIRAASKEMARLLPIAR